MKIVVCCFGVFLVSVPLQMPAQTLADVARSEREKRAAGQNKTTKVYTSDGSASRTSNPPDAASGLSILERQRKIAELELEIAGIEESMLANPNAPERGFASRVSELRTEIQKLRDAPPPLPSEPAPGNSYDDKQKRVYALMPESERAELLVSLSRDLSRQEAAFREQICDQPKPECAPLAESLSKTRRSIELLESMPPPPAP